MKKFLILVILAWQGECMVLKKNPYPGGIHPQVIPRPEGSSDIIMQGGVKDESGDAEGGYWWNAMDHPRSNDMYYPNIMHKQWGNNMHHPNMMNKHGYNNMYHRTVMNKPRGNNVYVLHLVHHNMLNNPWKGSWGGMVDPYMTGGLPGGMGGMYRGMGGMRSSIGGMPSIGGSNKSMPISEDFPGGMDGMHSSNNIMPHDMNEKINPEITANAVHETVKPGSADEAEGGYNWWKEMDLYNKMPNSEYKMPY